MRSIFVAVSLLAVGAVSASAADLSARPYSKAPVMAPAINWSGFYAGVNAGGAWGTGNTNLYPTLLIANGPPGIALAQTGIVRLNSSSATGGLQAGYNYQTGNWLLGVEADANFYNLRSSASVGPVTIPGNAPTITTESTHATWLATFRPRAGVIVGQSLFYLTGGLAVGNVRYDQTINFFTIPDENRGSVSQTHAGWTVGAGWEYLLNPSWSIKAEYLYTDLGKVEFDTVNTLNLVVTYHHEERFKVQVARLGLNYHFNQPVVAKY